MLSGPEKYKPYEPPFPLETQKELDLWEGDDYVDAEKLAEMAEYDRDIAEDR